MKIDDEERCVECDCRGRKLTRLWGTHNEAYNWCDKCVAMYVQNSPWSVVFELFTGDHCWFHAGIGVDGEG